MGFIKFLGTAGARFVMIRQLRSSAGIWVNFKSTNLFIDPGPGAIVKCNSAKPKLDVSSLDAVILTHKHLDHSNDVNVMIEAMTEGGFRKRGSLFAPSDSLGCDGVVFSYLKSFLENIVILKEGEYRIGDISFSVPIRNIHSVETYGVKFLFDNEVVSFVSDTKYFPGLIDAYKDSTVLVMNVVFYQPRSEYEHLSLDDALEMIRNIKPKRAIITHFGMSMLKAHPHILEKKLKDDFPNIIFAYDGFSMEVPLDNKQ
ncbi:MAG: MBL fold metallo-hydrolase [Candidatus Omnitrophica bacterium]|nr:MBL fold metallo-hydrolase [Candidatus Omnitrophota bacterium]MCM8826023.1 MBL fold metallo-hydrolase [Candidatus Omnitrophota bacterium]